MRPHFPHTVLEVTYTTSQLQRSLFHIELFFRSWFQRQQTCPTCRLNILRTSITAPQPQQQPLANNNQNARPNEAPAAPVQQNPFLNLLGNQQAAGASAAIPGPQLIPGQGVTMPPPFFFPAMPFMAPYAIPPPPMPQNLEQLTVEELRAMEGNERKHVEERLKLLRNVQTMLNASAALMSQYQMVVANLPPIPVPPIVPTSSTSTAPEASSSSKPTVAESSQVKLEDVGSEENVVDSKSAEADFKLAEASTSKFTTLESATSTFIANESLASTDEANGDSEEANEIRKRRLQKFAQSD